MREATITDYVDQASRVLSHFSSLNEYANRCNFNFMARGEPLSNNSVLTKWDAVADELTNQAIINGIRRSKFNLSTIMPMSVWEHDLAALYGRGDTHLYYSLYSMREDFRRRWLPKAMDPEIALDRLAAWQQKTGRELALHWAFIKGENDDLGTLDEIITAVHSRGIVAKFNAVRYNPYSDRQGEESDESIVLRNFAYLHSALGGQTSRIVPRVGQDVAASCGCFLEALNQPDDALDG